MRDRAAKLGKRGFEVTLTLALGGESQSLFTAVNHWVLFQNSWVSQQTHEEFRGRSCYRALQIGGGGEAEVAHPPQ